nr:MAG TPA: hypothetical protein [Caudoviricetes sp.]
MSTLPGYVYPSTCKSLLPLFNCWINLIGFFLKSQSLKKIFFIPYLLIII